LHFLCLFLPNTSRLNIAQYENGSGVPKKETAQAISFGWKKFFSCISITTKRMTAGALNRQFTGENHLHKLRNNDSKGQ